jgi:hypothetical protein
MVITESPRVKATTYDTRNTFGSHRFMTIILSLNANGKMKEGSDTLVCEQAMCQEPATFRTLICIDYV